MLKFFYSPTYIPTLPAKDRSASSRNFPLFLLPLKTWIVQCTLSWPLRPHSVWKIQRNRHSTVSQPTLLELKKFAGLHSSIQARKNYSKKTKYLECSFSRPKFNVIWPQQLNSRTRKTARIYIPGQPALLSTFLYLHVPLTPALAQYPAFKWGQLFLPALRCTFRSAGPNSKISLPMLNIYSPTSFLLLSSPGKGNITNT